MPSIFDGMDVLQKALDLCSIRHEILSANISNADTPNYIPEDIDFEAEIKRVVGGGGTIELISTNPKHIVPTRSTEVKPRVFPVGRLYPSLDGNAVDIDRQMAELSKNTLEYQALVRILTKKFSELRYVITEGRR